MVSICQIRAVGECGLTFSFLVSFDTFGHVKFMWPREHAHRFGAGC